MNRLAADNSGPHGTPKPLPQAGAARSQVRIPTLGEMLQMPPTELCRLDLAFLNLLCATGLPDTPNLDVHACLAKLHQWIQHVKNETQRNLHRFRENPAEYRNSEAYWRAGMIITVLQQDCGVRYNPDCIDRWDCTNSGDNFIHGILQGDGGTCANLPVLYAAVARRLGYPVYICCAKTHLFNRWTTGDGRERFNFDGSSRGMNVYLDDHYMQWPRKIDPKEVHLGFYLRNLDHEEEVALFMATRGHCLRDRGLVTDAIAAFAQAHRLGPYQPENFYSMMEAINEELRLHDAGKLPNSYREWDLWKKVPRAKRMVLKDDFQRLDKSRPVFRPTQAIIMHGFQEGEQP